MKTRVLFLAISFAWLLPAFSASAESFSMEQAVLHALAHSPSMKSSSENLAASQSALEAARSSFGPSVSASYGLARYSKERSSRYEKSSATMSVTVSQPVFRGFELLNAYQKAALQKEKQELQHEADRIALAKSVQEAFISHAEAAASVKSDRDALERAESQLAMARTSYEIGLRPRLDVLQAEADCSRVEAQLIRHENDRDVWRAKLNALLDLPAGAGTRYTGGLGSRTFRRTLAECLRRAMEHRPELLMARKSADIAARDLGIARSSFWPQLSAVAGWSTTGSRLDAAGSRFTRKDYSYAEAGLNISWTLFTSGRRVHLERQAEHQLAALEAAVRTSINSCACDIRSSLLAAQDAARTARVSEKAAAKAREAYEDAKARYELQSASHVDLLTARSALSDAELAEISARAGYLRALAALYAGMGELNPDLVDGAGADGRPGAPGPASDAPSR